MLMSERPSQTPEIPDLTRREFIEFFAKLGGLALGSMLVPPTYEAAVEAYEKFKKVGNDYSNDPFLKDAIRIDRARLNELLADSEETLLPSYQVNEKWQDNPENLAEYAFFVEESGPVHVELDGLIGSETSLNLLRVSVDEGEELLIPLMRDPADQSPITVQLGIHEAGRHQFSVSIEDGTVDVSELAPRFIRENPNSFRSLVDTYQPIILPRDPSNIADNFPVRTLTFVYETPDEYAFVYWKECVGEDREYGRFGSSAQQLYLTKQRTTDIDWDMEVRIDKATLEPKEINIAEPFHNRVGLPLGIAPGTVLKIASLNNNVKLVTNRDDYSRPGIHIRSNVHTHDERWAELYSTNPAIARFSVQEHIRKGNLNPRNPTHAHIITEMGLDVSMFQN